MSETAPERGARTSAVSSSRALAFAVTWLAYASYYLGRKGFSVTKVAVARELGLGTPALATIDTAFLLAYALGQVPSGVLADRIGARKLVSAGLLVSALACAAFGSGHSALVLGACFALNGLAQATGWPGTTKAMAEWTSPADRGRVMGAWSTCYQVGGMAATALAAFLLARFGWRAAFNVPALWLLAMSGAVFLLLRPGPRQIDSHLQLNDVPQPSVAPPRRGAFGNRLLYSYGACYFCLKLIRYSLLFWLPFYLHTVAGFAEAQSGYLSMSFEIGGVLGSAGLGWLSDRGGQSRARTALFSLLGLSAALWSYAQLGAVGAGVHFASIALIGALLFGPDALLAGAAAQDAAGTQQAATAVGLVNGIGSLGALLQGPLIVSVQSSLGWHALFYVFFALSLLSCACLLPALRARRG